ncbi:hypothetical protein ACJD0Z_04035 [Flavobacteriaceae bacterium M23B6Z8]
MKFKRILILIIALICLVACYPLLIQRSFENDNTGNKHITILKRPSGTYVVPYKYYGLLTPTKNYIKYKHKHSFNIVWNPKNDSYTLSIIDSSLKPHEFENLLEDDIEFLLLESNNDEKEYLKDNYDKSDFSTIYLADYSFFFGKNSFHYD